MRILSYISCGLIGALLQFNAFAAVNTFAKICEGLDGHVDSLNRSKTSEPELIYITIMGERIPHSYTNKASCTFSKNPAQIEAEKALLVACEGLEMMFPEDLKADTLTWGGEYSPLAEEMASRTSKQWVAKCACFRTITAEIINFHTHKGKRKDVEMRDAAPAAAEERAPVDKGEK